MKRATYGLVLALAVSPAGAATQSAATSERSSLEALVREVRLLRSAVERQTAIAVRSQVLAGRLAARLQQVSRAQDAVDRAAEALEAAGGRQEQLRGELAGLNAELAPLLQDLRRSELERAVRTVEAELSLQDREVARLRSRHQLAQDRLSAEQQRYQEAETALGNLERQVAP